MAGYCNRGIEAIAIRHRGDQLIHRQHLEGIRHEIVHQQEEGLHRRQDCDDVRHEIAMLAPVGEDNDRSVGGEQPAPEQQRTFLPAPPGGELVHGGHGAIGMLGDIGETEIAGQQGMDQNSRPRASLSPRPRRQLSLHSPPGTAFAARGLRRMQSRRRSPCRTPSEWRVRLNFPFVTFRCSRFPRLRRVDRLEAYPTKSCSCPWGPRPASLHT